MKIRSVLFSAIAVTAAALSVPVQAAPVMYGADLSGAAEAPPNSSTAFGATLVTIDLAVGSAGQMIVNSVFFGLGSGTTAAHIHCCTATPFTGTAGVATTTPTFAGFPLGATGGAYNQVLDLGAASTYNAAFVTSVGGSLTAARDALIAGLNAGTSYFNIHTVNFPNGEIRGFLSPLAAVPEPGTVALLGGGLLLLAVVSRRQRGGMLALRTR